MPFDPFINFFVSESEVSRQVVDDIGAELGIDDNGWDVSQPVVEDAAGEVVGTVPAVSPGIAGWGMADMMVKRAGTFGVGDGDAGVLVSVLGADIGSMGLVHAGRGRDGPWSRWFGVFIEPVFAPRRERDIPAMCAAAYPAQIMVGVRPVA